MQQIWHIFFTVCSKWYHDGCQQATKEDLKKKYAGNAKVVSIKDRNNILLQYLINYLTSTFYWIPGRVLVTTIFDR